MYARGRCRIGPTRNLDTFDPERERMYESFNFEFRARPGRGITLFGGFSFERQLDVTCTAPDDPNTLRFCDDHENDIPYRKNFKLSGNVPLPWGINLSAVFQSNHGQISTRNMAVTRGTTRLSDHLPGAVPGGPGHHADSVFGQTSLTVQLVDQRHGVHRAHQSARSEGLADVPRSAASRVTPTFEVYNLNNSDAIISYVSHERAQRRRTCGPNSIMQSRFYGLGFVTRW